MCSEFKKYSEGKLLKSYAVTLECRRLLRPGETEDKSVFFLSFKESNYTDIQTLSDSTYFAFFFF